MDMKQVLAALAERLTLTARERADEVMRAQANAGAPVDYRANEGGWN
jgi:hypothetical protein